MSAVQPNDYIIETEGLTKRYPNGTVAVEGLNLRIRRGEVYGLLGPNGAGKTTTILMLLGLTEATGGSVTVAGHDPLRNPLAVKRLAAYMPDSVGFYPELTAVDNLDYTGRLMGLSPEERKERIAQALERMRLSGVAHNRVGTYSRGMRQRLGLAEVLMKRPRVAILDEPTQGLDPESAYEFLQLIRSLRTDGITVLLSSHLLDQVQQICDRVGLFYEGRLILEGSVEELAQELSSEQVTLQIVAKPADKQALRARLEEDPEVEAVRLESHSLDTLYRQHLEKERQHANA